MNQLHEAVLCRYIKVIKILFQGSAINVEFIKQSNMHKIWLHILDILLEATLPSLKEMYNEKCRKNSTSNVQPLFLMLGTEYALQGYRKRKELLIHIKL